ncbi:MAG: hypothetical protein GC185_07355 [Alphaproteobacteria bacterium]|nr:hypothetical protein [Alphaproteobacteria bacterium]
MTPIDNPLFLAVFAGIAFIAAILLAVFKNRHARRVLKPLAGYAAADAGGKDDFSRKLPYSAHYVGQFFLHFLLATAVSFVCVGGFSLLLPTAHAVQLAPGDYSYALMLATWLLSMAVCGLTWHALFSTLRESRLYDRVQGRDKSGPEIFLRGDELYAAVSLTDGAARALLRLYNKPFLRLPLKQVASCRIERKNIVFTLQEPKRDLTLSRRALGDAEKPLVEAMQKKLSTPIVLPEGGA